MNNHLDEKKTIIHIGAGSCSDIETYRSFPKPSVILIDANPECVDNLKYLTRNDENIQAVQLAASGKSGPRVFKVFDLPEMSSLSEPLNLFEIFPGIRLEREIRLNTQKVSEIMKIYNPTKSNCHLIIDALGEEASILTDLIESETFLQLKSLVINFSAISLFNEVKE